MNERDEDLRRAAEALKKAAEELRAIARATPSQGEDPCIRCGKPAESGAGWVDPESGEEHTICSDCWKAEKEADPS